MCLFNVSVLLKKKKVGVNLFETEFLGRTKNMTFKKKKRKPNLQIDLNDLSVKLNTKERAIIWKQSFGVLVLIEHSVPVHLVGESLIEFYETHWFA